MSLKASDRVYETSITTGTGTYTLAGAVTGFQPFSDIGANNTCPYFATDGTNWEVGIGQYLASPDRLARTTIFDSSNAGAAVDWAAGTRDLKLGFPASFMFPAPAARSSNTILGLADHGKTIVATATFTQTLEAAATLGGGWFVNYRNDGTGVITIDPNASETIDGAATLALYPGEACKIVCDGSAFKTVGLRGIAIKIGSFTRDMTLANAPVAYTGIGFKPRLVIFIGGFTGGGNTAFVGATDGVSNVVIYNNHLNSADSWVMSVDGNTYIIQAAGAAQTSVISSLDTDGFTLSWTKIGSPTGTATVGYVAIR